MKILNDYTELYESVAVFYLFSIQVKENIITQNLNRIVKPKKIFRELKQQNQQVQLKNIKNNSMIK